MPDNNEEIPHRSKNLLACANCGKKMEDRKDYRCIKCGDLFCEDCESLCQICSAPICKECAIKNINSYPYCPNHLAESYQRHYFQTFDTFIEFCLLNEFKAHFIALETEEILGKWIDLAEIVIYLFENCTLKLSRYNIHELMEGYDTFLDASQEISTINKEVAADYHEIEGKLRAIKTKLYRENDQLRTHLARVDQQFEGIRDNDNIQEERPPPTQHHKRRHK